MAAQKRRKHSLGELFEDWKAYQSKTPWIKIHNSLDSSRPCERLLESTKTAGSIELFLPENYFKPCSAKLLMPTDPTKM